MKGQANVIPFPQKRVTDATDNTGYDRELDTKPSIDISYTKEDDIIGVGEIETKELYPLSSKMSPNLFLAFQLLEESLQFIDQAIEYEIQNDKISADDSIQHLFALLPELFCLRTLGDGFGTIVNSIFHSISNRHGVPLESHQLKAVRINLLRLNTEPFLDFGEAVDEIIKLESVGLEVEPSYLENVSEIIDG